MKKIFTYISILMAGLAVSCIQNVEPEATDFALSFEVQVTDLETRSAGVDSLHENDIRVVDWFFFSDEEGTHLLYHKTTNVKTLDLDNATVTANGLTGVSYLYAVANGPDGISSKTTLAEIKQMPVSMTYTKVVPDPEDENKPYNKLDKDHLGFIMDTYNKETGKYLMEVSPKQVNDGVSGSVQAKITVPLSRLAAKISPVIKIKKSVTTTDTFGNTENWTPVLTNTDFDVYMVNALNAGKMDGVPVRRADTGVDQSNYFDYGRNVTDVMDISPESGDYAIWRTVHPFYTFPQKWNDTDNAEPYIKIIFPWMSDVKGSSEFHYKVVLPKPTNHVFTLERNCWYQLTATIAVLGGTENDYVLIDDVEVSVADWAEPSWLSGSGLNSAKFFYVPTKEFDVYSLDSFNIPINTNSSAKAYITKIEFADYSGSSTVNLSYTWATSSKKTTVSNTELQRDNSNPRQSYSNYTSEHTYSVSVNSQDRYDKYVTFAHSLSEIYVLRTITIYIEHSERSDWHETVIIHQHPAIELKKQGAGDVFVNGRFARVVNATFGVEYTNSQGTFKHSGNGNSDARINEYERTFTVGNGWNSTTYDRGGQLQYGTITKGTNVDSSISTDWYTTDITVTAFNTSNNYYTANNSTVYYKIGDPRVSASSVYSSWELDNYLTDIDQRTVGSGYNATTYYVETTSPWLSLGSIKICSQSSNERNVIAPHFLISSALNAIASPYITFEEAVKRAATYQEAGYPAGRWRLPTEAEVAFIIARQKDGTLPNLYANNTVYWSGSGRAVSTSGTSTNITFSNASSTDGHSCRFVYDLWYWGYETMSPNQYHPNQHEH